MKELTNIDHHLSLKILRFIMRVIGLWPVDNRRDELIAYLALATTVITVTLAFIISSINFYYQWGDLQVVAFNAPSVVTVAIELVKIIKCAMNRREVVSFNFYTEKRYWKMTYNAEECQILDECNRKSIIMVITHIFFSQCVVWLYISIPIVESSGKNASARSLPLPLHINFPWTKTPYYEMAFILESASIVSIGLCAAAFSGFLGVTNLYASGQFKILQHKLEHAIYDWDSDSGDKSIVQVTINSNYANVRDFIKEHQSLIFYMERVENLFSMIMLTQAVGSVGILCFCGFQILLGTETFILRILLSVQFLIGAIVQLLLFAWPCHEIITESQEIAEAAYRASWYAMPHMNDGRKCRQSLLFIIIRARKPCIITVGKFAPMSLETFSSVFSTAISYFTVLRQMEEGTE